MQSWIFIPITALGAVVWSISIIVDASRRRQQVRLATEFHGKLLDRIGSAREFGEFLSTTGGTQFLDALTLERAEGGVGMRILRAVQSGLVFLSLGIGLFILIGFAEFRFFGFDGPSGAATGWTSTQTGIGFLATICTSVGVGLLLSAAASYVLSKAMHLLDDGHGPNRRGSSAGSL